jgi:hypothetical protein
MAQATVTITGPLHLITAILDDAGWHTDEATTVTITGLETEHMTYHRLKGGAEGYDGRVQIQESPMGEQTLRELLQELESAADISFVYERGSEREGRLAEKELLETRERVIAAILAALQHAGSSDACQEK